MDPLNIILYFLCGADIFDGLSWLRFGLHRNHPIYFNSYAISSGNWTNTNYEIRLLAAYKNLKLLEELTDKLKTFTKDQDLSVFNLDERTKYEIKTIIETVKESC